MGGSSSVEEQYPSVHDVMQSARATVDQQIQNFKNKFDNMVANPDGYMQYTPIQKTIVKISRLANPVTLAAPYAGTKSNLAKSIQVSNHQLVMLEDNRVIVGYNDFPQFAHDAEVIKNNLLQQIKTDPSLANSFGRLVASADQLAEDIKNFITDFCKNNFYQPGFDTRTSEAIIMQQNLAFVGCFTTCYNITTRTNEGTTVLSVLGLEIKVATSEYIVDKYYWNLAKEQQFLVDLKTMEVMSELVGSVSTFVFAKKIPQQNPEQFGSTLKQNVEGAINTQQQLISKAEQAITIFVKSPEISAIFAVYGKFIDGEKHTLANLLQFCQTAVEENLTAAEFAELVGEYREDVFGSFHRIYLEVRDGVLAHYIPDSLLATSKSALDKLEATLINYGH